MEAQLVHILSFDSVFHRYSVDGQESEYFSSNITCFNASKVDDTEYENIPCSYAESPVKIIFPIPENEMIKYESKGIV